MSKSTSVSLALVRPRFLRTWGSISPSPIIDRIFECNSFLLIQLPGRDGKECDLIKLFAIYKFHALLGMERPSLAGMDYDTLVVFMDTSGLFPIRQH